MRTTCGLARSMAANKLGSGNGAGNYPELGLKIEGFGQQTTGHEVGVGQSDLEFLRFLARYSSATLHERSFAGTYGSCW